jgi:hypothetical protein
VERGKYLLLLLGATTMILKEMNSYLYSAFRSQKFIIFPFDDDKVMLRTQPAVINFDATAVDRVWFLPIKFIPVRAKKLHKESILIARNNFLLSQKRKILCRRPFSY